MQQPQKQPNRARLILLAIFAILVLFVLVNFVFRDNSSSTSSSSSSSSLESSDHHHKDDSNNNNNNHHHHDKKKHNNKGHDEHHGEDDGLNHDVPTHRAKRKNRQGEEEEEGGNDEKASKRPRVYMETEIGPIIFELRPDAAPKTVANFLKLCEVGFFSSTGAPSANFYRYEPNFCFQFGGWPVKGSPFPPIPLEYKLPNKKYAVSMARTADPNSATSEVSIMLGDNSKWLGPGGSNAEGYAVFAQVIGQESFRTIEAAGRRKITLKNGLNYLDERIKIVGVKISNKPKDM